MFSATHVFIISSDQFSPKLRAALSHQHVGILNLDMKMELCAVPQTTTRFAVTQADQTLFT